MKISELSLGLNTEGDILSLSEFISFKSNYILDSSLGAKHSLSDEAAKIVRMLNKPVPVLNLFSNSRLTNQQIMEILFFINNIGGLKIKRSLLNRIKLSFYKIQLTFKGIKCVNNIRRFDANLIGLIKSFLSSFVFAILAITLTAILIYGANFSLSNYAVYSFIFLSSIFVSSIIHEYVHIYYSRKLNNTPSIIVDGIRIGVLSRIKDPRIILLSSLHGPLAGFISCIAISIILFSLGLSLIFYLIPLLASLVHLFSILPIYGDGKYIWKYIKNKQLRINHA